MSEEGTGAERLDSIIAFLRKQGYHGAEQALLSEIIHRRAVEDKADFSAQQQKAGNVSVAEGELDVADVRAAEGPVRLPVLPVSSAPSEWSQPSQPGPCTRSPTEGGTTEESSLTAAPSVSMSPGSRTDDDTAAAIPKTKLPSPRIKASRSVTAKDGSKHALARPTRVQRAFSPPSTRADIEDPGYVRTPILDPVAFEAVELAKRSPSSTLHGHRQFQKPQVNYFHSWLLDTSNGDQNAEMRAASLWTGRAPPPSAIPPTVMQSLITANPAMLRSSVSETSRPPPSALILKHTLGSARASMPQSAPQSPSKWSLHAASANAPALDPFSMQLQFTSRRSMDQAAEFNTSWRSLNALGSAGLGTPSIGSGLHDNSSNVDGFEASSQTSSHWRMLADAITRGEMRHGSPCGQSGSPSPSSTRCTFDGRTSNAPSGYVRGSYSTPGSGYLQSGGDASSGRGFSTGQAIGHGSSGQGRSTFSRASNMDTNRSSGRHSSSSHMEMWTPSDTGTEPSDFRGQWEFTSDGNAHSMPTSSDALPCLYPPGSSWDIARSSAQSGSRSGFPAPSAFASAPGHFTSMSAKQAATSDALPFACSMLSLPPPNRDASDTMWAHHRSSSDRARGGAFVDWSPVSSGIGQAHTPHSTGQSEYLSDPEYESMLSATLPDASDDHANLMGHLSHTLWAQFTSHIARDMSPRATPCSSVVSGTSLRQSTAFTASAPSPVDGTDAFSPPIFGRASAGAPPDTAADSASIAKDSVALPPADAVNGSSQALDMDIELDLHAPSRAPSEGSLADLGFGECISPLEPFKSVSLRHREEAQVVASQAASPPQGSPPQGFASTAADRVCEGMLAKLQSALSDPVPTSPDNQSPTSQGLEVQSTYSFAMHLPGVTDAAPPPSATADDQAKADDSLEFLSTTSHHSHMLLEPSEFDCFADAEPVQGWSRRASFTAAAADRDSMDSVRGPRVESLNERDRFGLDERFGLPQKVQEESAPQDGEGAATDSKQDEPGKAAPAATSSGGTTSVFDTEPQVEVDLQQSLQASSSEYDSSGLTLPVFSAIGSSSAPASRCTPFVDTSVQNPQLQPLASSRPSLDLPCAYLPAIRGSSIRLPFHFSTSSARDSSHLSDGPLLGASPKSAPSANPSRDHNDIPTQRAAELLRAGDSVSEFPGSGSLHSFHPNASMKRLNVAPSASDLMHTGGGAQSMHATSVQSLDSYIPHESSSMSGISVAALVRPAAREDASEFGLWHFRSVDIEDASEEAKQAERQARASSPASARDAREPSAFQQLIAQRKQQLRQSSSASRNDSLCQSPNSSFRGGVPAPTNANATTCDLQPSSLPNMFRRALPRSSSLHGIASEAPGASVQASDTATGTSWSGSWGLNSNISFPDSSAQPAQECRLTIDSCQLQPQVGPFDAHQPSGAARATHSPSKPNEASVTLAGVFGSITSHETFDSNGIPAPDSASTTLVGVSSLSVTLLPNREASLSRGGRAETRESNEVPSLTTLPQPAPSAKVASMPVLSIGSMDDLSRATLPREVPSRRSARSESSFGSPGMSTNSAMSTDLGAASAATLTLSPDALAAAIDGASEGGDDDYKSAPALGNDGAPVFNSFGRRSSLQIVRCLDEAVSWAKSPSLDVNAIAPDIAPPTLDLNANDAKGNSQSPARNADAPGDTRRGGGGESGGAVSSEKLSSGAQDFRLDDCTSFGSADISTSTGTALPSRELPSEELRSESAGVQRAPITKSDSWRALASLNSDAGECSSPVMRTSDLPMPATSLFSYCDEPAGGSASANAPISSHPLPMSPKTRESSCETNTAVFSNVYTSLQRTPFNPPPPNPPLTSKLSGFLPLDDDPMPPAEEARADARPQQPLAVEQRSGSAFMSDLPRRPLPLSVGSPEGPSAQNSVRGQPSLSQLVTQGSRECAGNIAAIGSADVGKMESAFLDSDASSADEGPVSEPADRSPSASHPAVSAADSPVNVDTDSGKLDSKQNMLSWRRFSNTWSESFLDDAHHCAPTSPLSEGLASGGMSSHSSLLREGFGDDLVLCERNSDMSVGGLSPSSCLPSSAQMSPASRSSQPRSSAVSSTHGDEDLEIIMLPVYHRKNHTGFESSTEIKIVPGDVIVNRYHVLRCLGSAAFSHAFAARDSAQARDVCLKVIKSSKDFFDQSLDEIKLLRYINAADPSDTSRILRLYDFFYYKEHLILVTELLRVNLYEWQKRLQDSHLPPYFTMARIQSIAKQVLHSLVFLHSLNLIHCDLKPENIMIQSFSQCSVKVIDLGSSCFSWDRPATYIQSRCYRAPEVIISAAYNEKIDIWSLGCILAELATGSVLFQNTSVATMLARIESVCGPLPTAMLLQGAYTHQFYSRSRLLYERRDGAIHVLQPKRTSLTELMPSAEPLFVDFLNTLLVPDPTSRASAESALQHPWLQEKYERVPYSTSPPPPEVSAGSS